MYSQEHALDHDIFIYYSYQTIYPVLDLL